MPVKYQIIDSHRTLSKKTETALKDFFQEVKGLAADGALGQVYFCDWYEKEYAVKWFEVLAVKDGHVLGYLRCLRDPDTATQWYVADVHVRAAARRQGIASGMYKKVTEELLQYEAAECVNASVSRQNQGSVKFHEKMGFTDTKTHSGNADVLFAKDETVYQKWLYQYLPIPNLMSAQRLLLPLWLEYRKSLGENVEDKDKIVAHNRKLGTVLRRAESGKILLEGIWCGMRLMGFRYDDGKSGLVEWWSKDES